MKKILMTLVAVLCCWVTLCAQQLTEQQALERALQYMNSGKSSATARRMASPAKRGSMRVEPASVEAKKIYAFNMEGGGYVIASADSRTLPVLGYSTTGSIDWENMPENMRSWLKQYDEAIATLGHRTDFEDGEQIVVSKSRSENPACQSRRAERTAVEPLIKTHWNQDAPYWDQVPKYQGPESNLRNKQCYVGCVATAMAQVMNYWQWPKSVPDGLPEYDYIFDAQNYTWHISALPPTWFDWDLMLNDYKVWNDETEKYDQIGTDAQRKAVATLMRYCGQSVKMMYSPNGSGTYSSYVATALVNYFDYNAAQFVSRRFFGIDEWEGIIYDELAAGRPMVYCGSGDQGGHSFVCDGYDGNGLFHINWGWAGKDDGYFSLAVLNPYNNTSPGSGSSGIGFSIHEGAVVYTDPKMEPQPELRHDFGSSFYQYISPYCYDDNMVEFYYTFFENYDEVVDHALGTIDSEGNLHPLFMGDPNDSLLISYNIYNYNWYKVEVDSTMFTAGQQVTLYPMLKFRHPGEQWQVIPPTELSLTAGRDENGRFFLYSNKGFFDIQPIGVSITKGTGRLDERSDLTIRVRNNESTDYTRELYLVPLYLGHITPEMYDAAPVLVTGAKLVCGAYIPANGEADVTFSFVPEYGGTVVFGVYGETNLIGELPLELNNDTLANYNDYVENKSYLTHEGDQWYWNVELADRIGVKMSHWIPSDNLYLCVRHAIDNEVVKFDRVFTGIKEYLAALPENIGKGDYTFTYRMPIEVSQPGSYYFDSYIAEGANQKLISYCCNTYYRITIADPTGIQSPTAEDINGKWFDLQGRPLSGKPTQRGFYIQGDKKLFVR